MNGLIAPLLALMMTGMVIAEQPQSSNFQINQDTAANNNLLGKFLLIIDDDVVRELETRKTMTAAVDPDERYKIDHVEFHSSEQNSINSNLESYPIQPLPLSDGSGKLQFLFSNEALRLMQRNGMRYVIPVSMRGRFTEVEVIYDPPNSNKSTTPVAQRPAPLRDTQQWQAPLAGSGQAGFIGPLLPNEYRQRDYRDVDQNQVNNGSFRTQLEPIATRRDAVRDNVFNDRPATDNRQFQSSIDLNRRSLSPIEDNRVTQRQHSSDLNRNTRDYSNAGVPHQLDSNDTSVDPWTQNQLRLKEERELALYRMKQDRLAEENEDLKREIAAEQRAKAQREFGPPDERYASTADPVPNDLTWLKEATGSRMAYGYTNEPITNTRNPADWPVARDRVDAAPRLSNKPIDFSIPGPGDATNESQHVGTDPKLPNPGIVSEVASTRIEKQNAALWFIMLCSIGLNFYLSWIARGFYVRYEELAEELRETFTSTMP